MITAGVAYFTDVCLPATAPLGVAAVAEEQQGEADLTLKLHHSAFDFAPAQLRGSVGVLLRAALH